MIEYLERDGRKTVQVKPSGQRLAGNSGAAAQPEVPPTLTYPLMGFLGSTIGTLIAIAAMPHDPQAEGALVFSGAILSAGLFVSPVLSFFKNPRSVFRAEHLLMYGMFYWLLLDLVQSAFPLRGASADGIRGAFICIGLFCACFWLSNLAPPHRLPRFIITSTQHDLKPNIALGLTFVCFSLAMFNYLYSADFDFELIYYTLLSQRWFAPWGRGMLGGWEAFRDVLQVFGYIVPTLTAVVIVRRGLVSSASITCLIMSLIVLAFVSHSGSRRIVGMMLGAAILFWVLSQTRLTVRSYMVVGLLAVALLVLMQLMFIYRKTGFGVLLYQQEEVTLGGGVIYVDDNFLRLAQVVDFFPDRVPYVTYRRLFFTAVRPIPRVFWQDKPLNWGFDLAEALGDRDVAWSSSLLADWFVMYGFLTVGLGGILYGRLCSWWSQVMDLGVRPVGLLVYSLGAMAIFCSLRQIDELVLMSYPLFGWILVSSLFLRPQRHVAPD